MQEGVQLAKRGLRQRSCKRERVCVCVSIITKQHYFPANGDMLTMVLHTHLQTWTKCSLCAETRIELMCFLMLQMILHLARSENTSILMWLICINFGGCFFLLFDDPHKWPLKHSSVEKSVARFDDCVTFSALSSGDFHAGGSETRSFWAKI